KPTTSKSSTTPRTPAKPTYLIPLIAWWMGISLLEAFWLDLALIVLIPCYTFLFNWAFDRLFGLPTSALPAGEAASV
ncbi:chlorhexidine efflux transporter, partial [Pseudomonas aeruginosa]|uniref:chlorhexidine efflux transporter n=1 Tax=Pseudomonas aeruginosa TaxID=287 RepID=UPI00396904A7